MRYTVCLLFLVAAHALLNRSLFSLDACPHAPYWPEGKVYNYGPSLEPTSLCFDSSTVPEGKNGFQLNFTNVKVVSSNDTLCAILGVLPFSGGEIGYVTANCNTQSGTVVAYGGVCNTRAMGDGYGLIFATQSMLLLPTPQKTLFSFSVSISWTDTRIC